MPCRAGRLCLFLEDGRVEIDSNVVERTIRPLALTRKNALFAGSDGGAEHWAAVITSLIETCKLIGSTLTVTSPTSSPASSTAIPIAASMSSCVRPITLPPNSSLWPENDAYQLIMGAVLNDTAALERDNAVSIAHGRQAMGNDQDSPAGDDPAHVLLDDALALVVERTGRLVEDQDSWIGNQRSSYQQSADAAPRRGWRRAPEQPYPGTTQAPNRDAWWECASRPAPLQYRGRPTISPDLFARPLSSMGSSTSR
jgi:Transposase IS66 family